jgi:hypothetical protein
MYRLISLFMYKYGCKIIFKDFNMVKITTKTIAILGCALAIHICDEASSEKSMSRAIMCAAAAACLGSVVADYADKAIKAGAPTVRKVVEAVGKRV